MIAQAQERFNAELHERTQALERARQEAGNLSSQLQRTETALQTEREAGEAARSDLARSTTELAQLEERIAGLTARLAEHQSQRGHWSRSTSTPGRPLSTTATRSKTSASRSNAGTSTSAGTAGRTAPGQRSVDRQKPRPDAVQPRERPVAGTPHPAGKGGGAGAQDRPHATRRARYIARDSGRTPGVADALRNEVRNVHFGNQMLVELTTLTTKNLFARLPAATPASNAAGEGFYDGGPPTLNPAVAGVPDAARPDRPSRYRSRRPPTGG
ncbi:cointegrate resolution protein T [Xanthomonas bromi]|uniref:Cointegrate resolution protein T n=1 Tax=Xanthomonas bromi TaxID=56449 RepID=A0A1C3NM31_9XANT|nr:cointegrate resolution protein T [Xanthomonas bromi]